MFIILFNNVKFQDGEVLLLLWLGLITARFKVLNGSSLKLESRFWFSNILTVIPKRYTEHCRNMSVFNMYVRMRLLILLLL